MKKLTEDGSDWDHLIETSEGLTAPCGCFYVGAVQMCRVHSAAPELLKALKEVWSLIENGQLVRDTSKDHQSDWAIKQIPVVQTLQRIQAIIAKVESP